MASPQHPLQEGSFDPLALLKRSRNEPGSETRTIMLRMLWLRQRIPDTMVETRLVSLDDRTLVMSATISVPGGGQGSGHVAVTLTGDTALADAVETAETRAIGRALDVLGYIVTDTSGTAAPERSPSPPQQPQSAPPAPVTNDAHRAEPPEHVRAIRSMREREQRPEPPAPGEAEPGNGDTAPTVTTPAAPPAEPPTSTQPPPGDDDDPELEDVSWTAFWGWARSTYQLSSKGQLEELLGQPIRNETPGQLRQMLMAHFSEDSGDES